jgi:hypothetical protein
MQHGCTPAYKASEKGHTETVALLLAYNADIKRASNVDQFKKFKCFQVIDDELKDFNIAFAIYNQRFLHMRT